MRPPAKSAVPFPAQLSSAPSIKTALDQVLLQEAHQNELRLAYVRAVVLLISSSLDVLVYCFPKTLIGQPHVPPTIALIGLSACSFALMVIRGLRRLPNPRHLRRLQVIIPSFDGALLGLFITNIWRVFGAVKPLILTNITAFCCLLAVSGGLRLRQRSAVLTTGLALVDFTYAAILFRLDPVIALFAAFTILGTGFLAMVMASLVHRHVKNEVGRILMERFLPKTLVETAFETPLALLQQPCKCQVTVMVTDLRGFTHFAEPLDPQAVLDFLNRYQGLLSQIVEQYGGWVDKFMGDGMLAVFGAPEPLDNHAGRAMEAGMAMLAAVPHISPLPMGIGIHSGPVVAGCLGTGNRMEFTAIGDTVNVASRLEALTKTLGTPLLVSAATRQQLGTFSLKSLGPQSIRGRSEPLEVFCPMDLP